MNAQPDPDDDPVLLTAYEVGKLLKVDPKTVRRWGQRGLLTRVYTPSRGMRFRKTEVDSFARRGQLSLEDRIRAVLRELGCQAEPSEDALDIIRQRIEGDS